MSKKKILFDQNDLDRINEHRATKHYENGVTTCYLYVMAMIFWVIAYFTSDIFPNLALVFFGLGGVLILVSKMFKMDD